MRLSPEDLRDIKILKYYRIIRRWACKQNKLKDADLELLIYLDCKGLFTREDFINGVYTYTWDKHRWERLRRDGWIDVWKDHILLDGEPDFSITVFICEIRYVAALLPRESADRDQDANSFFAVRLTMYP